jgi:hypothetical protein
MKRNDVASAPLLVEDILELSDKLAKELRLARAKVVEAYALRRKQEEQCRKYEQIVRFGIQRILLVHNVHFVFISH